MEQNRPGTPPHAAAAQRRRRHRIRLVRNWTVFLLSCGAMMAVMTGGILAAAEGLRPHRAADGFRGPGVYRRRRDGPLRRPSCAGDSRNRSTEEPTPELAVADEATPMRLEAEAAAAYRQMAEAARQDGIELVLTAGHQDAAARQSAQAAVQSCPGGRKQGRGRCRQGRHQVQSVPEASEGATGYAADILAADSLEENTGFADTRAYEWLEAYAAEYGFILRWPQELSGRHRHGVRAVALAVCGQGQRPRHPCLGPLAGNEIWRWIFIRRK